MSKEELLKHISKWMYCYQKHNSTTPEEADIIEKVFDEVESMINEKKSPKIDYSSLLKNAYVSYTTTNSSIYDLI